MVKITNGTVTTEVTKGAYDTFYKEQGFVVVSDENENIEWEEEENDYNQYSCKQRTNYR